MNYVLLASAICLGGGIGLTTALFSKKIGWLQIIFVAITGVTGSIVMTAGYAMAARDAFLGIHLMYLVGVIGVPLASLTLLTRSFQLKTGTKLIHLILVAGLLPAPIGIYGTYIEPFWLRVDRVEIESPEGKAGIKIGVLSDLQTTRIGDYENEAIDTLLAQEPDVVLIPGDFYQLHNESISEPAIRDQFTGAMAKLSDGVDHVYAVSGDTDRVEGLEELTTGTDVVVLDNETAAFTIDGVEILVGGINRESATPPQIIDELVEASPNQLTVLLTHRPDEIFLVPEDKPIDLVVAGHTHGGQISLPIFGPPITLSEVPREIGAGGLHELNGQSIYVSTGVGRERGTAPQVRLGVRPSIGIIATT